MSLKIGNYSFREPNRSFETVDGGEAIYDTNGVPNYLGVSNGTSLTKEYEGSLYYVPSILVGGEGDDIYSIGGNEQAIIADTYDLDSDRLALFNDPIVELFSIDNRHIFYSNSEETFILGVDFLNNIGEIDTISLYQRTYTISNTGRRVYDLATSISGIAELNAFVELYKTRNDQTWQNVLDLGLLKPEVIGLSGVNGIKTAIEGINAYKEKDGYSFALNQEYELHGIRDYDGYLHANVISDNISKYKYQGLIDVNADGTKEAIFTNKESGRWVTASINRSGEIDYSDHGSGGTTRVVGIYIDPLVTSGDVVQGSDFDSQRRFQNDLEIDNLIAKTSGDYDGDGFQEVYWKTNDGTAYLRALMHADGNIQYANYQSEEQMSDYLTSKGYADVISDII